MNGINSFFDTLISIQRLYVTWHSQSDNRTVWERYYRPENYRFANPLLHITALPPEIMSPIQFTGLQPTN